MPSNGGATVLLVEDDPAVRRLIARFLSEHDFQVISVGDSSLALEVCRGDAHVDILVTDLILPGLNGLELAAQVAEARPEIRTLVMSGYTASAMVQDTVGLGIRYLDKPFLPSALLAEIQRALREPIGGGEAADKPD